MIPRTAAAGPRARSALVPAAVAFLLGLPALGGGWVWDDPLIVKVQLGAFRTVGSLFFPPVGIPGFSVHYYRPLTTATFLLDRALYGERAWGFHLTPLLLHACAAGLVYLLLCRLLAGRAAAGSAAMAGALLFAALPVHAESVAWIAGRADPLAAVCLLAACLCLLRRPLGPGALAAGTAFFVAGCLAKEVAFALVPLLPALSIVPRDDEGRRGARGISGGTATAVLAGAALAVLVLRAAALGGAGGDAPRGAGGAAAVIERLGGALAYYLPRVLVPLPAAPYVAAIPGGAAAWAGLAAGAAVLIAGLAAIRLPRWRAVGAGLLFFLLTLAPSLVPALRKISVTPLAERYLYVPSIGAALAVAGLLPVLPAAWLRRALSVCLLAAAALGTVSFSRAFLWRDEISLWTAASRTSSSAVPAIHLARAYDAAGRSDEAAAIYEQLLAKGSDLDRPERALAMLNLGVSLVRRGRDREAEGLFEESVVLDPGNPLGWYNLANALWPRALAGPGGRTGDPAAAGRALEAVRRAARLAPLDPRVLVLRGRVEAGTGHGAEAREALLRAVELDGGGAAGAEARALLAELGRGGG